MSRIALVCSEPLREAAAGIGIRYLELARRLPRPGLEVLVVTSGDPADVPPLPAEVVRFEGHRLAEILGGCAAAVVQGHLADEVLRAVPDLPVAVDLYDPWLVENLHYTEELGFEAYQRDHASLRLQLARGDFFLCASAEQRTFYLGFLAALGRINPVSFADDPDQTALIAEVPFGVPDELPAHVPCLPARSPGERRLLFGCLYDWYDPWTLLEALVRLDRPGWRLFFVRTPNPATTPQRLLGDVEAWCRDRGWWGDRVTLVDWVPAERRYDLFRDVDALVAPDRPSLESSLSLRTRFLEALAAGSAVVCTDRGGLARTVSGVGLGAVVPAGDPDALAGALAAVLYEPPDAARREAAAREVRRRFSWQAVLEPLVAFCTAPRIDWSKETFAVATLVEGRSRPRAVAAPALRPPAERPRSPGARVAPGRSRLRKVTVAVLTWNGREHLEWCLNALAEQQDPGVEWNVTILDNGSRDGTAEWLRRRHPEVELVTSEVNLGFAAGNNLLAAHTDADAIALLNNDTSPAPGWLGALVDALGSAPDDVAAVAGKIVDWSAERLDFAGGIVTFDGHAFQTDFGRPLARIAVPRAGAELPFGCGANLLVRRAVYDAVGGFDGDYFAYFEDVDLGWRLWSAGYRILFAPDAVVAHRSMATSSTFAGTDRGFLFERNAFLTAYKNYEDGLWEKIMPAILLTLVTRTQSMLETGDPDGARLRREPIGGANGHEPRSALGAFARGNRNGKGTEEEALSLANPRSIAQLRVISSLVRGLDASATKRRAVQRARRRRDAEFFERFPAYLVPTYPGDEELFRSAAFQEWLPRELPLVRKTLAEIMERRG